MDTVVTAGHPSLDVSPTRNAMAESGYGRAISVKPTMVKSGSMKLVRGGRTMPQWGQSRSFSVAQQVIPASGQAVVSVKSANSAPDQMGFPGGSSWGIAGATAGTKPVPPASPSMFIPALAIGALIWLTMK